MNTSTRRVWDSGSKNSMNCLPQKYMRSYVDFGSVAEKENMAAVRPAYSSDFKYKASPVRQVYWLL